MKMKKKKPKKSKIVSTVIHVCEKFLYTFTFSEDSVLIFNAKIKRRLLIFVHNKKDHIIFYFTPKEFNSVHTFINIL